MAKYDIAKKSAQANANILANTKYNKEGRPAQADTKAKPSPTLEELKNGKK